MSPSEAVGRGFAVGEWTVQPELNRINRGDAIVALEPRLMDVLVFLTERAGEVVSKDELVDGVWKVEFISDWAITRAIAKLRRVLGDEAGRPRYIETISKRGYRLIAAVRALPRRVSTAAPELPVGQWVRGPRFFGRRAQLVEALDGPRACLWVAGTRQSGKTSLLRQLELVAEREPERGLVPLFWDLEGAEGPEELEEGFGEALAEAAGRLEALGLVAGEIAGLGLHAALGALRRGLGASGKRLLLLCDEGEELLLVQRAAPAALRRLRRALQAGDGIRAVLAASPRLWALAEQREDTSPFLHGFAPPVYLGPLEGDAARAVLEQARLDEVSMESALDVCGGHPYLLALLGARTQARGSLPAAVAELEADPTLDHLFAADMALLGEASPGLLAAIARGESVEGDGQSLFELERLGLVRRSASGPEIGNRFLQGWLSRRVRG